MNIVEVTVNLEQMKQYAQRVVAGGGVLQVWLIGSATYKPNPNDIDLLYVLDPTAVHLAPDASDDDENLIYFLENHTVIEPDLYDTFYQIGNTFWHLSWGAGASLIRNDEYAQEQQGRQKILLASR